MYSEFNALQNLVLGLVECASSNLHEQVMGYIDPNTMHHVFTFLGPIAVFFATGLSVIVSAGFLLRHRLVAGVRKTSCLRLIAICLVVVSVLAVVAGGYKLVLHLVTH